MRYQSNIDTSDRIFDYRYLVSIRALDVRSIEDIKAHGTYTTGTQDFDQALMNSRQRLYLNIAQMVDYHKQGIEVRLINPADGKAIYEAITAHLERWVELTRKNLNLGNAPVDDLRAMDKFAHDIYDVVKYQFSAQVPDSDFIASLQNLINDNTYVTSPINDNDVVRIGEEKKPSIPVYEERQGFSDLLKTSKGVRVVR